MYHLLHLRCWILRYPRYYYSWKVRTSTLKVLVDLNLSHHQVRGLHHQSYHHRVAEWVGNLVDRHKCPNDADGDHEHFRQAFHHQHVYVLILQYGLSLHHANSADPMQLHSPRNLRVVVANSWTRFYSPCRVYSYLEPSIEWYPQSLRNQVLLIDINV
jgi:hypothetical protein